MTTHDLELVGQSTWDSLDLGLASEVGVGNQSYGTEPLTCRVRTNFTYTVSELNQTEGHRCGIRRELGEQLGAENPPHIWWLKVNIENTEKETFSPLISKAVREQCAKIYVTNYLLVLLAVQDAVPATRLTEQLQPLDTTACPGCLEATVGQQSICQ